MKTIICRFINYTSYFCNTSKHQNTMEYQKLDLRIENSKSIEPKSIRWRSPSNIALVKYWGKYGQQLPRNPSISLTLNNAASDTTLRYSPKQNNEPVDLSFYFEGKKRLDFAVRIEKFLISLLPIFPFIEQVHFKIESSNSFPHSAGIASSASAMSALALCLCSMEKSIFGTLQNEQAFLQKASHIARLGSGSASRSIYPHIAVWGEHKKIDASSNLYAIPYADQVHQIFQSYHDDILIISKKEKSVSSGAGHGLMNNNLYADNRYIQANQRLDHLLAAMKVGDLETFGEITEAEALTLHALMMTSSPPYLLMEPNSIAAIRAVQAFRNDTKLPLYFTLDAGPNLHLLYPDSIAGTVQRFIESELLDFCENEIYLPDYCGQGPEEIKEAIQ